MLKAGSADEMLDPLGSVLLAGLCGNCNVIPTQDISSHF